MAQKLVKFIEMDEFKKILKVESDKRFKLAYVLGMGSGLRISEIIGYKDKIFPLTQEQVNLQQHKIEVLGKRGKQRITVTSPFLNEKNIKMLPLDIPRRTLQGRFSRLCKKVLGRKLSFHTLRHGFANHMANVKSIPLPMVQQMLGHSRLDTTGIYTKSNPVETINKAWESF